MQNDAITAFASAQFCVHPKLTSRVLVSRSRLH